MVRFFPNWVQKILDGQKTLKDAKIFFGASWYKSFITYFYRTSEIAMTMKTTKSVLLQQKAAELSESFSKQLAETTIPSAMSDLSSLLKAASKKHDALVSKVFTWQPESMEEVKALFSATERVFKRLWATEVNKLLTTGYNLYDQLGIDYRTQTTDLTNEEFQEALKSHIKTPEKLASYIGQFEEISQSVKKTYAKINEVTLEELYEEALRELRGE